MNYAVVLNQHHFVCLKEEGEVWRLEPINREERLPCTSETALRDIIDEFQARLDYQPPRHIIVLYDGLFAPLLTTLVSKLQSYPLLVLPLSMWVSNAGAELPWTERYCRHLLPGVCQQLFSQQSASKTRPLQEMLDEHEALMRQLHSEQQENLALQAALKESQQRLQTQTEALNDAQQQVQWVSRDDGLDAEAVAQFMPLFFPHFWQRVSVSDFALLLGSLTLPDIKSPYPEPERSTLVMKKRGFMQLRMHHQQQIRALVQRFMETGSFPLRPEAESLMGF